MNEMTLDDLTITPTLIDLETLLSSWSWASDLRMKPVLLTKMGDVFAQAEAGAVYIILTAEGEIAEVAEDGGRFEELLTEEEFVTSYFAVQDLVSLESNGLSLEKGECFAHKKPLILGGEHTLENMEATDFAVHVDMMGQIHQQVVDLPDGATISDIKIV